MIENIYLYFTGDLHSYFDHWSRVASFIKNKREEHLSKDNTTFLFDIGDHIDRVHPISEASMGKSNVHLMNDLNYDVITIGNNEGITISHQQLRHLYDDAAFSVVCSNLQSLKNAPPSWLQKSKILKTNSGVSIGLIGLTAPFNPYYNLLDWHVDAPFKTIGKELDFLRGRVDIVVLLSHLGIYEDQRIANQFPEIDVIIGGHTHHLLRTTEIVNHTLITAAGKHCAHVGEVVLEWDHDTKKIVNKNAFVTDITELPRDFLTEQRLKELELEANIILDKKIVNIEEPLKSSWFKNSKLMEQFTEKLLNWTKADIAMLNAGLVLDDLPKGKVTYGDVHRLCPHPINPCVVEVNGAELAEIVRVTMTKEFMELKLKGFGFRGEVLGKMVFSGIDIDIGYHENGHQYVKEILYLGKPINEKQTFSLATADTFTFGRLLPEVAKSKRQTLFLPEFIRYLLVLTLVEYEQWKNE